MMTLLVKVFLFVLGLSAVKGTNGVEQCSQGASFWCKSYLTAKQCDQLDFCKQVVWAHPIQNDEVCMLCKDAIGAVSGYIARNGTEEKIKSALTQLCKDVPIPDLSQQCFQVINQDFDMLYDEVITLIENGDLVCGLLGLCKTSVTEDVALHHIINRMPALVREAMERNQLPVAKPVLIMDQQNDCSDCEAFLRDVQKAIRNNEAIVKQWKGLVKNECDALGPGLSPICNMVVSNYYQTLLNEIAENDATTICKSIDMCGFSAVKGTNDQCMDCKKFFSDFENMIKANNTVIDNLSQKIMDACQSAGEFSTVDEFVTAFSNFYCLQKPSYLRPKCARYMAMVIRTFINRIIVECKTVAKQALPQLWKAISTSSPDQICQAIDFCESASKAATTELVGAGDPCKDCTTFMTDLQGVAKNNQSIIDDLTDLVKEQCDQLGPGLSELCKIQVTTAVPTLISQFKVADVGTICTTIMMCSSPPTEPPKGGDLCNDCIAFTEDWQNIIQNNKTVIAKLLDQAAATYCKQLPSFVVEKCDEVAVKGITQILNTVQHQCSTLVKDYLPGLWNLVAENDAETICSTLYMCDAAQLPELPKEVVTSSVKKDGEVSDDGELCELCKIVVTEVDRLLEQNATEAEVMAALEKVCGILSSDIKAECKMFVEQYGPDVVDLLINEIKPDQVCGKLNLCAARLTVQDSISCELCETVAQALDDLLDNQSTEAEIVAAVEKVCTILPAQYQSECNSLIQQYGDAIIQLLVNLVDPQKICAKLGLCKSTVGQTESSELCEICVLAAGELEKLIEEHSTEEEITKAVEKVCSLLPSQYASMCDSLIEQYGPQIIQALVNKVPPKNLCSDIGVCASALSLMAGDPCKDCTTFMTDLQGVAKNNQSIIDDLTDLVKGQCDQLGPGLSELCKIQVTTAVPTLISQFKVADVGTICTTIMMCSSPPTEPPKGGDLCNDCIAFTEDWQNIIQNNKTVIAKLLDQAAATYCKQLPSFVVEKCDQVAVKGITQILNSVQHQCATFVKDYLPYVWNLIQYNDAETICSTLYMCNAVRPQLVVEKQLPAKVEDTAVCEVCQAVSKALDQFLGENRTEQAIAAAVEQVCGLVPPAYATACDDLVDEYSNAMIKILLNAFSPQQLCTDLKLCPKSSSMTNRVSNPVTCVLCKIVIHELDKMIEGNRTEAAIVHALERVCSVIPGEYGGDCRKFIDQYGSEIVDMLINEVESGVICKQLLLCSAPVPPPQLKVPISCDLCETVSEALENLLKENSTEQEIINAVEKVCTILPSQYQSECDDLIKQYGETIIQLLLNDVTPQKLCSAIGLCSTSKKLTVPISCDLCETVSEALENLLKENSTEQEIINAVEKVCTILPSQYQSECDDLIKQYGETIIQLLLNDVTPQKLCSAIGLCSTSKKLTVPISCDLCETVSEALENLLKENSTEQEIINAVEKVCTILPSQYQSECDDLIKQYGETIIQLLLNDVTPQKLCSAIGLCSTSKKLTVPISCDLCETVSEALENLLKENSTEQEIINAVEKVCTILPSQYQSECDDLIKQYGETIIQLLLNAVTPQKLCSAIGLCSTSKKLTVSSETCDLCVVIATELENLVTENSTEEEITHAVEKVCAIVPKQYSSMCDSLIELYGPKIIQTLVNKVPPTKLCSKVGLCTSVASLGKASHAECLICQMIITDLEVIVLDFKDETALINALAKICDVFPASLKSACVSFIDQNADQLIRFAFAVYPPEYLCMKINVCSLSELDVKPRSDLCPLCELVATQLDKMITTKSTQAEAQAALDKVCSLLPGSLTKQCDDFIASVLPAILELLAKEVEPSKLCSALKLCAQQLKKSNGELCGVCTDVIGFLDEMLETNATRQEIEKALLSVCDQAPGALEQTCDELVKQYTPEILDLADHIFDPDYVCLHLGLCGQKRPHLGTDHCTYGPAYWCQNEATAAECHASEHCRRHVWN